MSFVEQTGCKMQLSSDEHTDAELKINTSCGWEFPIPFSKDVTQHIDYPLSSLPNILRKTIVDYQQYGQQPYALVACGALANVSLAPCVRIDVASN